MPTIQLLAEIECLKSRIKTLEAKLEAARLDENIIRNIIYCELFGMSLDGENCCFGDRPGDEEIMDELAREIITH